MDSPMADIIDETFNRLSSRYGSFEEQIDTLPPVIQNFLLVVSAQGVIDNGGYRYFFGADWPGNPPYSKFIDAYQSIGCEEQAKELERVVGTFPSVSLICAQVNGNGLCALIMITRHSRFVNGATSFVGMTKFGKGLLSIVIDTGKS